MIHYGINFSHTHILTALLFDLVGYDVFNNTPLAEILPKDPQNSFLRSHFYITKIYQAFLNDILFPLPDDKKPIHEVCDTKMTLDTFTLDAYFNALANNERFQFMENKRMVIEIYLVSNP